MATFHFRLQRVRDWQMKVCAAEEQKLRETLRALESNERALVRVRTEFRAAEEEWRRPAALSAVDLRAWNVFRPAVFKQERSIAAAGLACLRAVEQQRDSVVRARRRLQMLDKLRDRALVEYRARADSEADEVAMTAHLNRVANDRVRTALNR